MSDLVHQVTLVIGLALFTQFALLPNHAQADANQHEKGNHDGNKKQNNLSPITVWKHSLILKARSRGYSNPRWADYVMEMSWQDNRDGVFSDQRYVSSVRREHSQNVP